MFNLIFKSLKNDSERSIFVEKLTIVSHRKPNLMYDFYIRRNTKDEVKMRVEILVKEVRK